MYVALALLAVAALMLAWHWHREGYPWAKGPTVVSGPSTAPSSSPASAASTPESGTSPAGIGKRESRRIPENAPASTAVETAKGEPTSETQVATQMPASSTPAAGVPAIVPQTNAAESTQSQEPANTGNDDATSGSAATQGQTGAGPTEVAENTRALAAKTSRPELKPPAVSGTRDDKLVAEGEKYLYGDGVPQNCARAQKSLASAAKRLNVKAQSLLGTMYATGHCTNRDLPTAYRWFAKALRQDPSNDRIKRDLEVLWREMTPDERQTAMRNQ
jgi:hypothetical protein